MMSDVARLLSFVFVLLSVSGQWVNEYDKNATFECGPNQVFSYIGSVHDNYYEDRVWQFRCKQAPNDVGNCQWHYDVNKFDGELVFKCRDRKVLTAISSYRDNYYDDRRFSFKCCSVYRKYPRGCAFTGFINELDGVMDFYVPDGKYISGFHSEHDNHTEDRKWRVILCDLDFRPSK